MPIDDVALRELKSAEQALSRIVSREIADYFLSRNRIPFDNLFDIITDYLSYYNSSTMEIQVRIRIVAMINVFEEFNIPFEILLIEKEYECIISKKFSVSTL